MKKLLLFILPVIGVLTMAASGAPPESDGRVNKYETRSELLMAAMEHVGVQTPEAAATVWGHGLMARSAAIQYSVMSARLKAEYTAQLDRQDSNWVTGVSSPWVQEVAVKNISKRDGSAEISLDIETMTSAGPDKTYSAKLNLIREGDFWRIDRIRLGEGLYPYTLYRPPG